MRPAGKMRRSRARAGPYSSTHTATRSWLKLPLGPCILAKCLLHAHGMQVLTRGLAQPCRDAAELVTAARAVPQCCMHRAAGR